MTPTYTSLPPFLRFVRFLAAAQYLLSAVGLLGYLIFSVIFYQASPSVASVSLEIRHPRNGQVGGVGLDSLRSSPKEHPYRLIPKSEQLALVYTERDFSKQLGLTFLGLTNSANGRSSLALILYSLFTGMLLYRILNELRLESPFTEKNARRIRWLGLLTIGVDVYQYLAFLYLQSIVPHFAMPDKSGAVNSFIVLDPALETGAWKFGLVLLVIAAVYQRGVVMAQEAELTV